MRLGPTATAAWAIAVVLPVAALLGAAGIGAGADAQAGALRIATAACAPHAQETLRLEIEALRRLQQLARREGDKLCTRIEAADQLDVERLIDPTSLQSLLSEQQRELLGALGIDLSRVDVGKLMRLLGIDPPRLDLQALKQQCRASQGGIERFASDEVERLELELTRCDGRI